MVMRQHLVTSSSYCDTQGSWSPLEQRRVYIIQFGETKCVSFNNLRRDIY